ncbi:cell-division initiation protein (septum placement) [Lactobacillus selangorensis]|uniref:Cell-division initiation protein (Septum placement) n=1 Tax=Lactobacillus selangorensis TaxID=81857 RepID=A0A0R2G3H8_9LACO|nr:DivIVA domain-containing protein [Lactobacillus selangorensis]KRN29369.1 cell-division initiation protein (septum placement) [Lactobacillus selangorensis]KRN34102.1 cell-division initiation protein (septum placement) [Lactobacillus selangorensis]
MALTPLDIHNKQFNVRMRGYDQDQVNDFLEQISKDYEASLKENEDLKTKLQASEEKVTYFNELKDSLNQSILVAQEAADKVKTNATKEAEIIRSEAEKNAQDLLNTTTDKSNHILEDASERARKITVETEDLKKQTRVFRQRLQVMLESQLEVVKSPEWNELLAQDDSKTQQDISAQIASIDRGIADSASAAVDNIKATAVNSSAESSSSESADSSVASAADSKTVLSSSATMKSESAIEMPAGVSQEDYSVHSDTSAASSEAGSDAEQTKE